MCNAVADFTEHVKPVSELIFLDAITETGLTDKKRHLKICDFMSPKNV